MSAEELAACVEEAGRRKVPVMAHAHGPDGILMASEAGCRSIEHASFIDQRGVEACVRNGTWIVPTFLIGSHFAEKGSATGAQDRMIELCSSNELRNCACIQEAAAAGVKIALGSDFVGDYCINNLIVNGVFPSYHYPPTSYMNCLLII